MAIDSFMKWLSCFSNILFFTGRTGNNINNIISFTIKYEICMSKDKIIIKSTALKCIYRIKTVASETTSTIATSKSAGKDITRGYPFI